MYEQKSSQQDELKIFGIKIIEKICESVDIYDHEFQDDKEEQGVLAKLPHHFFHRHDCAVAVCVRLLNLKCLALRGGTPLAPQWASLQKQYGPESGSIMNG